ncbi:hypothetical protein MPSI1_003990 [Malassezia psittaci]|uniref:TOG domain-containing protein n=1 Tax=Malassezia psittaci TaxID=1821823 RepID=A0AAF0FIZ1_9BASI|nr:hypothetical protein MPSI1_003990 [Malassezia psittaci]
MDGVSNAGGDEDLASLSLDQKLDSKVWKVRLAGYEELVRRFAQASDEHDPIFAEYARKAEKLRAMALDSNAAAQEKALEALVAFVSNGGYNAGQTREVVLPAVAEKALNSMRTGTRNAGFELVLLYAEKEDKQGCEDLLNNLTHMVSAKQPKQVAANVAALANIVESFGVKPLHTPVILRVVPKIFAHPDKQVRAEGSRLVTALHVHLGPALAPTLSQLKDIQRKELEAKWEQEDLSKLAKPTRFLHSEKPTISAENPELETALSADTDQEQDAPGPAGTPDPISAPEIDPYEIAEPVDALQSRKLAKDFFQKIVSTKWQERLEAVDSLLAACTDSIRLKPNSDYDRYVQALQVRLQKDVNLAVVLQTCKCLEALANGLRSEARSYMYIMPAVLEKLKERKPNAVEVVSRTLDALFQVAGLNDVIDTVQPFGSHKNPAVKAGAVRYVARCLQSTSHKPTSQCVAQCGPWLLNAMQDGAGDVRDAAANALGTLWKLVGERAMHPYMDALDEVKRARVHHEAEKVHVLATGHKAHPTEAKQRPAVPGSKAGASACTKPPALSGPAKEKAHAPVSKSASKPLPSTSRSNDKPIGSTTGTTGMAGTSVVQRPLDRKPEASPRPASIRAPAANLRGAVATSTGKAGVRSGALGAHTDKAKPSSNASQSKKDMRVVFKYSVEDVQGQFDASIPAKISALLKHASWKERLQGVQDLHAYVRETPMDAELLVRCLSLYPGWKESNFQVLAEVYSILRTLADDPHTSKFDRAAGALSIPALCDKLGDLKLKVPASQTLDLYAEVITPAFVVARAIPVLNALKAPKAQAEAIAWLDQLLLAFGPQDMNLSEIVAYLVNMLKSANPLVRSNATKAMGTLARFVGTSLLSMLGDDVNAQLRSSLQTEIESNANKKVEPSRFVRQARINHPTGSSADHHLEPSQDPDSVASSSKPSDELDEDALEQLVPRVDLDSLLPKAKASAMNDTQWKVRKEALESIQSALAPHPRLKGSLGEFSAPLKARYGDNNLMVRMLALDIALKLANGLHLQFEPYAPLHVPAITQVLADSKASVRNAALTTLSAIQTNIGLGKVVNAMASVLDSATINPTLRQEAFGWLSDCLASHLPQPIDLTGILVCILGSLDDRTPGVRQASHALLPYVLASTPYPVVIEQCDTLKPASRSSAMAQIEAARAAAAQLRGKSSGTGVAQNAATSAVHKPSTPRAESKAVRSHAEPKNQLATRVAPRQVAVSSPTRSIQAPRATPSGTGIARLPQGTSPIRSSAAASRTPASTQRTPSTLSSRGTTLPRAPLAGNRALHEADRLKSPEKHRSESSTIESTKALFKKLDPRAKQQREKSAAKFYGFWTLDGTVRADCLDTLQHQMEISLASEVYQVLFSQDHHAERDFVAGLRKLQTFVSSAQSEEDHAMLLAHADLLIKYGSVRLMDKNTSVALQCFEFLELLLKRLTTLAYQMSDIEAGQVLLPALVMRLGDPKTAFREQASTRIKQLAMLFAPSRILTALLESGVDAKSARTRAETLHEIEKLLVQYGIQVCTPSKAVPILARMIGDRDASVRNAALQTLAEMYKSCGSSIWNYVGTLPAKDESMLEERLKRTTVNQSLSSEDSAKSSLRTASHASIPLVKDENPTRSDSSSLATAQADSPQLQAPTRTQLIADDLRDNLKQTQSTDIQERITAWKGVQSYLDKHPALSQPVLDAVVDHLVKSLEQIDDVIGLDAVSQRQIKHLLQTTLVLLDAQRHEGSQGNLDTTRFAQLVMPLLTQLQKVSAIDQQEAAVAAKHWNAVVLRALSTTNANVVYSACFRLLAQFTKTMDAERETERMDQTARLTELVIKCVWKIARKLPDTIRANRIDGAQLLATIEEFLQTIPPIEWGRRVQRQAPLKDIPLITATNVLKQLIEAVGEASLTMLDTLPDPEGSHVYRYLLRLLYAGDKQSADSGSPAVTEPTSEEASKPPADDQSTMSAAPAQPATTSKDEARMENEDPLAHTTTTLDDDVVMLELRGIFDRISQKDQSRAAIRELYAFQNRYPMKQADIQRSLQNTGPIFQRYIKRALANHAAEDAQKSSASTSASVRPASERREGASLPASARAQPWSPTSRLNRGTRESGATMDARLAELKAKFRKDADGSKMPGKTEQRTSMSSEALRQRLNSMRPDS